MIELSCNIKTNISNSFFSDRDDEDDFYEWINDSLYKSKLTDIEIEVAVNGIEGISKVIMAINEFNIDHEIDLIVNVDTTLSEDEIADDDALFDLNTAIEMCDTIGEYYNQRGIVYSNMEKHADALFDFQTAIKMSPNLEYIHNNIGLAYEHNGFKDKAIEHYKLSIRKEPYQSDSYYNLGRLNYENRNYKTAIRYLKEAYHLNPNFGDITHILGLCYLKIDEKETACNYFQISIDAGCESALNSQKEYCSEQVSE
jgi:tetratricopeptide (TPR) repeat protein